MKKTMAMMMAAAAVAAQGVNLFWGEAGGGDISDGGNWRLNSSSGTVANQVPVTGDNAYFRLPMTATLTTLADFYATGIVFDTSPQDITLNPGGKEVLAASTDFTGVDLRIVNGTFGSTGWTTFKYPSSVTAEDGGVVKIGNLGLRGGSMASILGGGTGEVSNLYIGYINDTGCSVLISGTNALLKMVGATTHDISITHEGAGSNSLEVMDGAVIEGATGNRTVAIRIGNSAASYSNTAFIHSGALVTNVALNIGGGIDTSLTVSNATVHCTTVAMNGPMAWTGPSSNRIVVVDKGKLIASGDGYTVGQHVRTNGADNAIFVSGAESEFEIGTLNLGEGSWRNRLVVEDGALFKARGTLNVGGTTLWGTDHEFIVDGATATVGGAIAMRGTNCTVLVTGGSALTMNGFSINGGMNCHLYVEPGCVVTNLGSVDIGAAAGSPGSTIVIDNAKFFNSWNNNYIREGGVLEIKGANSVFHTLNECRIHGPGIFKIIVGRHGFVETPVKLGAQYIDLGVALHIHADEWVRKTGGEQTLVTVTNPALVNNMNGHRTNAVLDSATAWLEVRQGDNYTIGGTTYRDIHLVLCAPEPSKGTTILVR